MAGRARSRGFSLIELLVVMVIIIMLITMILTGIELRHRTLIKTAVVILRSNLATCATIASISPKHRVAVLFRPTDSDHYTSYTISSDIQKPKTIQLPRGARLINTNNFIVNHTLRVGIQGVFIDEFGQTITSPDPGIITIGSAETSKVYRLVISNRNGTIDIK